MTINDRLRRGLHSGLKLKTPTSRAEFLVEEVGSEGILIRVGKGRWPIKIPWRCFKRIGKEFAGEGWILLGGLHGEPLEGTLDWVVQQYTGGVTASSYVAPILEHCGIAEIDRGRPGRMRLVE